MLSKKQNLTSGKKAKIRKGDLKEKREETNKNEKGLMNKNFVIEYFDVAPFMKQKQRRNQKKERDKNKKPQESKKERQEGRKKGKKKRETEKEKVKKGEAKKGYGERKGDTQEINKKCPF